MTFLKRTREGGPRVAMAHSGQHGENVDKDSGPEMYGSHHARRSGPAPLPRSTHPFTLEKPSEWRSERQGAPTGLLLSARLMTSRDAKPIAEPGLAAINRVHGVTAIQSVPIITWPETQSAYLQLNWTSGVPEMIVLPIRPRRPRISLIHEIGHLVDFTATGLPNVSSAVHDLLWEHWRGALRETDHMRVLGELEQQTSGSARETVRYNMRLEEAWSRSYTQYIAIQSERTPVLDELASFVYEECDGVQIPRQWLGDDFDDLQAEIYEIFRHLGWQR